MPDQKSKIPDDPWLIANFKNFENMPPTTSKAEMDWSVTTDFQVFSEYLVKDIKEIQQRLKKADLDYLYYVCGHIFNIQDWMKLMLDQGFDSFTTSFEKLFEKHVGDKHILQNIYDSCFEKWMSQKTGQQRVGANCYSILEGKLYYRNRFGEWFDVDKRTAFDIKPKKQLVKNKDLVSKLKPGYTKTWYDRLLDDWGDKNYQGRLPEDFLKFGKQETSPEEYFDFTLAHIKKLIKNPVSLAELERWNGGKIRDIEDDIKIFSLSLDAVKKLRNEKSLTVYLLRDGLIFYEAHRTLDLLDSHKASADQLMIGRKLLSHKDREWAYYIFTLAALYDAHRRYPKNFEDFYKDYVRLLDMFVSLNPGFRKLVAELAEYIRGHIDTENKKIVIFDTGFQASINLLVKYIIDRHVSPSGPNRKIETDIKVAVGAAWSKELFGDRYQDEYFPFLNRAQFQTRSNELYHYKPDSLSAGKLRVLMGDKENQHKAAIELVILVTITMLAHEGS